MLETQDIQHFPSSHEEDHLKKSIIVSCLLHVGLVLVMVVIAKLSAHHLKIGPSVVQVSLVDLPKPVKGKPNTDLPKATVEELKKPPAPKVEEKPKAKLPEVKPSKSAMKEKKKKPAAKPKKTKEKPKDKKKLEKSINSEISALQKELELEKQIASIAATANEKPIDPSLKGIGNPDGVQNGDPRASALLDLAKYQDIVRLQILSSWNLPSWALEKIPKGTFAILQVYVEPSGKVLRTEIKKSSNLNYFDQSAIRAVRRADPLAAPPPDLAKEAQFKGITMRFSPRKEN